MCINKKAIIFCSIYLLVAIIPAGSTPVIEDMCSEAYITGMGGTYEGSSSNINSIGNNPSLIANILKKEIGVMYGQYSDTINYKTLAMSIPLETGVIGSAVSYIGEDDEYYTLIGVLSYGHRIYKENKELISNQIASAGVNIKIINKKYADENTILFAADFGLLFCLPFDENLRVGAVVKNMGGDYNVLGVKQKLPGLFELNISRKNLLKGLNIAINRGVMFEEDTYFGIGAEYDIGTQLLNYNGVMIRLGYIGESDIDGRMSIGLGFKYKDLMLDYGMMCSNDQVDSFNILTLRYSFGKAKEDPNDTEKLFQSGRKYYLKGNLPEAKKRFDKIYLLDRNYKETKQYVEVINKTLSKLKKEMPLKEKDIEKTQKLIEIGDRCFDDGKYDEAIKYYIAVLVIDKNNSLAKQKIASARKRQQEFVETEKLSSEKKQSEQLESNLADYFKKGLKYYEEKKFLSALSVYRKGYRIAVKASDEIWVEKFNKYIRKAKKKLAEKHYEKGYRHYQKNSFEDSVEELKKALSYDPEYIEAREKLKEVREKIQQINIKTAERLYERGLEEYTAGNVENAIEMWEKAVGYDDNHMEAKKALERAKARKKN